MKDPSKVKLDEEIAEEICERLATGMDGLAAVLRKLRAEGRKDVPSERLVYYWRAHISDFQERYKRAREMQSELALDEAVRIAQTPNEGTITTSGEAGGKKVETVKVVDNVERSKLIVSTLWQRAKSWNKELCGDSLAVGGMKDGNELVIRHIGGSSASKKQSATAVD